MRKRKHIKDPLLGFGWVGCVSAVILIALVVAMFAGVELRYELMKLVVSAFGVDSMMLFVIRLPYLGFSIFGISVSIVTGASVLLAMKIAPYRFRSSIQLLIFVLCTFWFVVALEGNLALGRARFGFNFYRFQLLEVLGVALTAVVLVFLTRCKLVAVLWGLAVVLTLFNAVWIHKTNDFPPGDVVIFYAFDMFEYTSFSLVFDLLTMGSLLVWAVLGRRKVLPEHMCESCGYDLAGLEDVTACPECGGSTCASTNDIVGAEH